MATIDLTGWVRARPRRPGVLAALRAGWQDYRRRRQERDELRALARLDPRLIRDAGLDPEQVYDAAGGAPGSSGLRFLMPRGTHV
jgi:uncharacterized protein YjiS (DUF1127 family)